MVTTTVFEFIVLSHQIFVMCAYRARSEALRHSAANSVARPLLSDPSRNASSAILTIRGGLKAWFKINKAC